MSVESEHPRRNFWMSIFVACLIAGEVGFGIGFQAGAHREKEYIMEVIRSIGAGVRAADIGGLTEKD